jgi:hypothetical protein
MKGALQYDELGKWTIGLLVLVFIGIFIATQYNSGVFSFFRQIPTNLTAYDPEDGSSFVRYDVVGKAIEYRTTTSWKRFDNDAGAFTLGKVTLIPGNVKDALHRYWYSGREGLSLSFKEGTLTSKRNPAAIESSINIVTLGVFATKVCEDPCVRVGDLIGEYSMSTALTGIFILKSNNNLELVKPQGSTYTFTQTDLQTAKSSLLTYRDSVLVKPVKIGTSYYCAQYSVAGKKGYVVVNMARPVSEDTTC